MRADDAAWSELYADRLGHPGRRGAAAISAKVGSSPICSAIGNWLAAANSFLERIVERAREAGQLRADCEPQDIAILQLMLGLVIDDVSPN
jgi:hypothetical protein